MGIGTKWNRSEPHSKCGQWHTHSATKGKGQTEMKVKLITQFLYAHAVLWHYGTYTIALSLKWPGDNFTA